MNVLFAEGFDVGRMVLVGLVGAAVALAAAFGRVYRARRDQVNSTPGGEGSASNTLSMVGMVVLCIALIFGGLIVWSLTR